MHSKTIERLLPAAYQRAAKQEPSVLAALLEVMELLHAPDEEVIEEFDALFGAYTTRDGLLPFLAGWVALDYLVGVRRPGAADPLLVPPARMRDLIAEAASLAQERGTPAGLCRFLELATGVRGFEITEPPGAAFHFVVRMPPAAQPYRGVVELIVQHEKPAATTFEVVSA